MSESDDKPKSGAASRKSTASKVATPAAEQEEEEWSLMTSEELEQERLQNLEQEEKLKLIEQNIEQHHEWKEDYDIKLEVVMKRWKQLNEKRDHRKFIEQMMS